MLSSNNSQYLTIHHMYGPMCAELMEFCCVTGLLSNVHFLVFQAEKVIPNT